MSFPLLASCVPLDAALEALQNCNCTQGQPRKSSPAPAKARAVGTEPGTPSGRLHGENQNHLDVSRHNRLSNGTGCAGNRKGQCQEVKQKLGHALLHPLQTPVPTSSISTAFPKVGRGRKRTWIAAPNMACHVPAGSVVAYSTSNGVGLAQSMEDTER